MTIRRGASDVTLRLSFPKLNDSEGEATEARVHIEFAFRHGYVRNAEFQEIDNAYEHMSVQHSRIHDFAHSPFLGFRDQYPSAIPSLRDSLAPT